MTAKKTRREAIAIAGAATVAAATATVTRTATAKTSPDDSELLSRITEFHRLYAISRAAGETWISEQHRVEALPDCPPNATPAWDREAYERRQALMRQHGVIALSDHSTVCWRRVGKIVGEIFATPARTLKGANEKLKIAILGSGGEADGGDDDLEAYQPYPGPRWLALVARDFERLAGEGGAP